MSIKDLPQKIKGWVSRKTLNLPGLSDDIFLGIIIILVAFGSFGLGRLSKIEGSKTPIRIENAAEFPQDDASTETTKSVSGQSASIISSLPDQGSGQFVGSKSGTKYYLPWCSGVKRITDANKIYFASKSDAEARGYTPSSTCKGL